MILCILFVFLSELFILILQQLYYLAGQGYLICVVEIIQVKVEQFLDFGNSVIYGISMYIHIPRRGFDTAVGIQISQQGWDVLCLPGPVVLVYFIYLPAAIPQKFPLGYLLQNVVNFHIIIICIRRGQVYQIFPVFYCVQSLGVKPGKLKQVVYTVAYSAQQLSGFQQFIYL